MSLINHRPGLLSPGLQYITSISRKSPGIAGDREMLTYDKVGGIFKLQMLIHQTLDIFSTSLSLCTHSTLLVMESMF